MKKSFLVTMLILLCAGSAIALPLKNDYFLAGYENKEIVGASSGWIVEGNEDNWGIVRMLDYGTSSGLSVQSYTEQIWQYQFNNYGKEVYGIFYDIDIVDYDEVNAPNVLNAKGGYLDLYLVDEGTFDWNNAEASDRLGGPGTGGFDGITNNATAELWLSLEILPYDTDGYSVHGSITSLSNPFSGLTTSYYGVISGSASAYFDTNVYNNVAAGADLLGKNSFFDATPGIVDDGWTQESTDPVTGYVVPEPTTFVLFGLSLLGLAGVSRKKYIG